jgi:hypothetical protein
VPATVSDPAAVTNATLSGAVGAVDVRPRMKSRQRFSAVFVRLSLMGVAPFQVTERIPALRTTFSLPGGSRLIHTL